VLRAVGADGVCTVNALPRALHDGEAEVNYGRKGHIRGSVNVPYATLLRDDGSYRESTVLREAFAAVGAATSPRVICYCGGGISATMDALALIVAGHANVAVYDGSLAEWMRDPALPMSLGAVG
jgi:thiosulfate/3-mercaptopyruvate sulfurtransferase